MTVPSAAPKDPPWKDGSLEKITTSRPFMVPVALTAPIPSACCATYLTEPSSNTALIRRGAINFLSSGAGVLITDS